MLNTNLEFSLEEAQTAASPVEFKAAKLDARSAQIHARAVDRARKYLSAEAELLSSIVEVDRERLYKKLNYEHLTPYCVAELKLSEDVAAIFVRVARKVVEVPQLKTAIDDGRLTMTKAKTLVSVITPQNQDDWISRGAELGKAKLERAVADANPQPALAEKIKCKGNGLNRIELELNDEELAMFRRCQDLQSQKSGKFATLHDVQVAMMEAFLEKFDPVAKAKRAATRQQKLELRAKEERVALKADSPNHSDLGDRSRDRSDNNEAGESQGPAKFRKSRVPIPAAERHAVNQRDQGCCRARKSDGTICGSRRWIHLHHIIEVANGGANVAKNIVTLCSAHHRLLHSEE